MKKCLALILLFVFSIVSAPAQLKPVAQKVTIKRAAQESIERAQLFTRSGGTQEHWPETFFRPDEVTLLNIDPAAISRLLASGQEYLELEIPMPQGSLTLELYRAEIFTPDFSVIKSSSPERPYAYTGGLHYQGIVAGDIHSLAAISVFNREVMGLIATDKGNLVVGPLDGVENDMHILYNDRNLTAQPGSACHTPEDNTTYEPHELQLPESPSMVNCIRLYWEVDYTIYQGKGGVTNATNYVTGLFNQSAIIFTNDNIPVELSEVFVWDTTDPYTATSTGSLLSQFQSYRNSFNGDLGHLLGYVGGGGIAAGFNGLCASNLNSSQCYSDINSSYNNVPTYSWSVMVVTHEQGHLMGSRHTHACVWNGNNTAIDNCGPSQGYGYEGSCSGASTPSNGGTIMSYCHLVGGVGINFNNGFGSQPAAAIINKYNAASCLSACGTTGCPTPNGLSASSITQTSATLNWGAVTGANTYELQHRESGATSWTTVAGLTTNSYNLGSLSPGAEYEWHVLAECTSGNSSYSGISSFTTSTPPCNVPTGHIATQVTMNSALLSWNAVAGALSYNMQYYETGTQNFISASGITGTSFELNELLPGTDYSFNIQAACQGSFSSYTAPGFFTTDGCVPPPSHYAANVTATTAKLKWTKQEGAHFYEMRYRVHGTVPWTVKKTKKNYGTKNISGLSPNTKYQWKVRTRCSTNPGIWSSWTSKKAFTTPVSGPARLSGTDAGTPGIFVFPNPASHDLTLVVPPSGSRGSVVIVDHTGRTVQTMETIPSNEEQTIQLDVTEYVSGLYLVRLQRDGRVFHSRVVIGR